MSDTDLRAANADDLHDRVEAQLADLQQQRELLAASTLIAVDRGDVADQARDVSPFVRLAELTDRAELLRDHLTAYQHARTPGIVGLGSVVSVDVDGDRQTLLIAHAEHHTPHLDTVTPSSPLGCAVIGRRAGDTVAFRRPDRNHVHAVVLDVRP